MLEIMDAQNTAGVDLAEFGRRFHGAGEKLYLVGGAVRDILAGRRPSDFDFTTTAPAHIIRKLAGPLAKAVFDKSKAKGFDTQGVILHNGLEIEITPFRRAVFMHDDGSPPSFDNDLRSRDFTINAVAVSLGPDDFGAMRDPCGGAADLHSSILRTPAPPVDTFSDDPLRPLRAVRFCVSFGLEPAAGLLDAIRAVLRETTWLDNVAVERVREEFEKMLLDENPSRYFRLMNEWGLLEKWLPELAALATMQPGPDAHHKDVFEHTMKVLDSASAAGPRDVAFRFAALLHDIGKVPARRLEAGEYSFHGHEKLGADMARGICERLRFSNEARDHTAAVIALHSRIAAYRDDWTDSAVRRAMHDMGRHFDELVALARADITSSQPEKVAERLAAVDRFLERTDGIEREAVMNPAPPLDGHEIMRLLDTPPGPVIGRVTNFLKDMIISGELDPGDTDTARRLVLDHDWDAND